jgi:multidrug resistance efflux pump
MLNCGPRARSSKASEAQVEARRAEAEFSKTTNERWRDSPKGVVSEQERDAKKADYESSQARLYRRRCTGLFGSIQGRSVQRAR